MLKLPLNGNWVLCYCHECIKCQLTFFCWCFNSFVIMVKVKVKNNDQCLYSHTLLRTHPIEGQREWVEATAMCCVLKTVMTKLEATPKWICLLPTGSTPKPQMFSSHLKYLNSSLWGQRQPFSTDKSWIEGRPDSVSVQNYLTVMEINKFCERKIGSGLRPRLGLRMNLHSAL